MEKEKEGKTSTSGSLVGNQDQAQENDNRLANNVHISSTSTSSVAVTTSASKEEGASSLSSMAIKNRHIEAIDDTIQSLAAGPKDEVAATLKNVLERGWDAGLMKERLERYANDRKDDINEYCSQHYSEFLVAAQKLLYTKDRSAQLRPSLKDIQRGMTFAAFTTAKEGLELESFYQIRKELATSIFFIQNCRELTSKIEVVNKELQIQDSHYQSVNPNRPAVLDSSKYVMILDILEQIETDINVIMVASNMQTRKGQNDGSTTQKNKTGNPFDTPANNIDRNYNNHNSSNNNTNDNNISSMNNVSMEEYNYTTTFISVIQDFLPKLYQKLKGSALETLNHWLVTIRNSHVQVGRASLRKAFGYMTGLGIDNDDLNIYTETTKNRKTSFSINGDARGDVSGGGKLGLSMNTAQQILHQMNTVIPWTEWIAEDMIDISIPYIYTIKDEEWLEEDQSTLAKLPEAMADLHRSLYIHGRLHALDEIFNYYKLNRLPQVRAVPIVEYRSPSSKRALTSDSKQKENGVSSSTTVHRKLISTSNSSSDSSSNTGNSGSYSKSKGLPHPLTASPQEEKQKGSKFSSLFNVARAMKSLSPRNNQPPLNASTSKLLGSTGGRETRETPPSLPGRNTDSSQNDGRNNTNTSPLLSSSSQLNESDSNLQHGKLLSSLNFKYSNLFRGCPHSLVKFHDHITYIAGYFVTEYVILHTCPVRHRSGLLNVAHLESEWAYCTREINAEIEQMVATEEGKCRELEDSLSKSSNAIKRRFDPDLLTQGSNDNNSNQNQNYDSANQKAFHSFVYSNTLSRVILHAKLLTTNLCFLFGDDTFFFPTDSLLQSLILLSDRLAYAIVQESKLETLNTLYDANYQPLNITNETDFHFFIKSYGLHNLDMHEFGDEGNDEDDDELDDLQPEPIIPPSRNSRNRSSSMPVPLPAKRTVITLSNGKKRIITYPKAYPFSLMVPRLCRILYIAMFKFFLFGLHIRMPKFEELVIDLLEDCLKNVARTIDLEVSFDPSDEEHAANFPISKASQISIDVQVFSSSLYIIEDIVRRGILRFLSTDESHSSHSNPHSSEPEEPEGGVNIGLETGIGNGNGRDTTENFTMTAASFDVGGEERGRNQNNQTFSNLHESIIRCQNLLKGTSSKAEMIIYELVRSKISDLLASGICFVQWDSTEPNTRPNSYVDDLITYLQVTFNGLRYLRKHTKEGVHFASCSFISSLLCNTLFTPIEDQNNNNNTNNSGGSSGGQTSTTSKFLSFGSPFSGNKNKTGGQKKDQNRKQENQSADEQAEMTIVKHITTIGLYNFSVDIHELERFADSTGVPQLRECFRELRQTLHLFLDPRLEELLRDEDARLQLYRQTDINKIISVLEKYKPSSTGMMAAYGKKTNFKVDVSHFPQLDKKKKADLLKDLYNFNN